MFLRKNKTAPQNNKLQILMSIDMDSNIECNAYIPVSDNKEENYKTAQNICNLLVVAANGSLFGLIRKSLQEAGVKYNCQKMTDAADDYAVQICNKAGIGPGKEELVVPPTRAFSMEED